MPKPKLKTPAKPAGTVTKPLPRRAEVKAKAPARAARKPRRSLPAWLEAPITYFRETRAELRKVQWPTWREAWYLTRMVVLVTFLSGAVLGAVDWIFAQLVSLLVLGA